MTVPGNLISLMLASAVGAEAGSHTFDATSTSNASGDPRTQSHTCAAGVTLLVVSIHVSNATRADDPPTYNGVQMHQIGSTRTTAETSTELFALQFPDTGSAYTISVPNVGNLGLGIIASSYTSSTGFSELDVSAGATGVSTTPTDDVVTTVDGAVIVDGMSSGDGNVPTANTETLLSATDNGPRVFAAQYALQETAGSITMGYTTASDDWGIQVGAWTPYAGDWHDLDAISTFNSIANPTTFSHTCSAGTTVLVLMLNGVNNARTGGAPTYNGTAMTQAGTTEDVAETTSEVWYLIGPDTGSSYTLSIPNAVISQNLIGSLASFESSTGTSAFQQVVQSSSSSVAGPVGDDVTPTKDGSVICQVLGSGQPTVSTSWTARLASSHDVGATTGHSQYHIQGTAALKAMEFDTLAADDYTSVCAVFETA